MDELWKPLFESEYHLLDSSSASASAFERYARFSDREIRNYVRDAFGVGKDEDRERRLWMQLGRLMEPARKYDRMVSCVVLENPSYVERFLSSVFQMKFAIVQNSYLFNVFRYHPVLFI